MLRGAFATTSDAAPRWLPEIDCSTLSWTALFLPPLRWSAVFTRQMILFERSARCDADTMFSAGDRGELGISLNFSDKCAGRCKCLGIAFIHKNVAVDIPFKASTERFQHL